MNTTASQDPVGTLATALAHAERLLASSPALAAEQAQEILRVVPQHASALLILAAAKRRQGDASGALALLEPIAASHGGHAIVHYELGLAYEALRRGEEAVASLRRAVELKPDLGDAWRALADHLHAIGDTEGADEAYAKHLRFSIRDPRLLEAGAALVDNRIAVAENLLRTHLKQYPTDIAAIRMLAEVAARLGRHADAEALLTRCLELAPSFTAARHNLASILHRQGKASQALAHADQVLAQDPSNPGYRNMKAAILGQVGEYAKAIDIYREVLAEYPGQPKAWMSFGHSLKSAGQTAESIAAYRRSTELEPKFGEAWWSLANLKTFRFEPADLATMRAQLDRPDLTEADRFHFHFAIGKALEDAGEWEGSFRHYAEGNRLRKQLIRYDADDNTAALRRSKTLFTKQFFDERAGFGDPRPDPIFIVGLPRSGSTLIEQILSSHSQVEGTMELPDVIGIARELGGRRNRSQESKYPEILATMGAADMTALGARYLEQTRVQRKTPAPFFIDKMPNNFAHVGLIRLMLPNAKIVDARRHPLACCFSAFKQHFARGQHFTFDLADIGRYYRDYVELMAHFDAVLPGRVHRVLYERMVEDTGGEVRRLLDYCGLPFEEGCLRFYENERAVRTASSEQVRQPIYREGVDHWRHFEPWLGPLREALGPVLEAWPGVPKF
ncbi:MAG TPA: sulfotransferase [Steroidobacteraceae bacterium]|nr:sulfotransferase [Steroidobacteraceae bacterium]